MALELSENGIVVVKIGTSSLTNKGGAIDVEKINQIACQIKKIKEFGLNVVLVSSGAIRAGMEKLGIEKKPKSLPKLQACAAAGQSKLIEIYSQVFEKYHISVAQILLTRDDFRNRKRFLNGRNTIISLLDMGCMPIVNENDTVATDEIKFGENDTLSAIVAGSIGAELLINLSDVDGLYTADPRKEYNAKKISTVKVIDENIFDIAKGSSTNLGSGGMTTKIKAAKIATSSGTNMIIANAAEDNIIIKSVTEKNIGTLFLANSNSLVPKKRWMAFSAKSTGSIKVNSGAENKISSHGKSLLPAGITEVCGNFKQGDMVDVINEENERFAKGIVYYSSKDIQKIMGKKTCEIENILGEKEYDEIIHHNNLVVL